MSERVKEILGWMRSEAAHLETSTSVESGYHAHMIQVIDTLSKELDGLRDGLDHHTHGVLYTPATPLIDHTATRGCALAKAVRKYLEHMEDTGKGPCDYSCLDALRRALLMFETREVNPYPCPSSN